MANAIQMKKTYFISDAHLGIPGGESSRVREDKLVKWLEQIAPTAQTVYLVGDLFDFWHDYKTVVPRGFVRFLGQLARMRDAGIEIILFVGNHDLWMYGYFTEELGIPILRAPIQVRIGNHDFFIGHGDGLAPNDTGYKIMKKVFTNKLCQWAFRWLHPDFGIKLALAASKGSRNSLHEREFRWNGEESEWLVQYCYRKISQGIVPDFFVFGHRHINVDWQLSGAKSRYINLGDWLFFYSWAEYDGKDLTYHFLEAERGKLITNR